MAIAPVGGLVIARRSRRRTQPTAAASPTTCKLPAIGVQPPPSRSASAAKPEPAASVPAGAPQFRKRRRRPPAPPPASGRGDACSRASGRACKPGAISPARDPQQPSFTIRPARRRDASGRRAGGTVVRPPGPHRTGHMPAPPGTYFVDQAGRHLAIRGRTWEADAIAQAVGQGPAEAIPPDQHAG